MTDCRSRLLPRRTAAIALAIASSVALWGCAAPPVHQPSTTVVLLPDEDGKVGAVSVSSAAGSQQLGQAFSVATTGAAGALQSSGANRTLERDAVDAAYGPLLKAQPLKPKTFILYFVLGTAELTTESKAQLPAVLAAARARKPTEISVFGHADAIGSESRNVRLSAERAERVARLLKASDPDVGQIDTRYFGARAPMLRPDAHGVQPKNRRAEVMIL